MKENNGQRIFILPPEEAIRIAAGEVVDRPAALVREFLDNAIDAGALNIDISIEEGGCKKTEVSDDGHGMSRRDLELCSMTHATSKIKGIDDLEKVSTLGFRGEALAAAAAVSRLEIISSVDGREAWSLETGPGENYPPKLEQTRRTKGTTVRAVNLFENIPARKRFLKREGSEGTLCYQAFIDKALAFPQINFRFVNNGKLKCFLPAVNSRKERFSAALLQTGEESFIHEINVTGAGFNAAVVISSPELYRNDRRQMHVFANGRKVQDYSLIQAMEYGAQGWFPNGTHPAGAVYIEIDPALADFNIHPAKREVRFRDPGAIHHAVSGGLRDFYHKYFLRKPDKVSQKTELFTHGGEHQSLSFEKHERKAESNFTYNADTVKNFLEKAGSFTDLSAGEKTAEYGQARYAGRLFGLFILIEWGEKLYIIDQHAAHERILYNRFLEQPVPKQELLAPIPFCTNSDDEDRFLEAKKEELSRLGLDIEKDENTWRIEALPADWRLGDAQTVKEILALCGAGENMAKQWAAQICCRAAIKDGDYPDDETAFALGMESLELADPHCPHGRPIWTEIGKDALFKAVRRE